jgi:hypothetical protein
MFFGAELDNEGVENFKVKSSKPCALYVLLEASEENRKYFSSKFRPALLTTSHLTQISNKTKSQEILFPTI